MGAQYPLTDFSWMGRELPLSRHHSSHQQAFTSSLIERTLLAVDARLRIDSSNMPNALLLVVLDLLPTLIHRPSARSLWPAIRSTEDHDHCYLPVNHLSKSNLPREGQKPPRQRPDQRLDGDPLSQEERHRAIPGSVLLCYRPTNLSQAVEPILLGWRRPGSNRQPLPCKSSALPVELRPPYTRHSRPHANDSRVFSRAKFASRAVSPTRSPNNNPPRSGRTWIRTKDLVVISDAL